MSELRSGVPPTAWRVSEAWRVSFRSKRVSFVRPLTGETVEVSGKDASRLSSELRMGDDLRPSNGFRPHGLHLLARTGALRPLPPRAAPVRWRGSGAAAIATRSLLDRGGWALPPLRWVEQLGTAPREDGWIDLAVSRPWLVALRPDETCPRCTMLRLAAHKERGPSGTAIRILVAELLVELSRAPLARNEVLLVGPAALHRVSLLPHPDCPACHPPVNQNTFVGALWKALESRAHAPAPGARAAYANHPLAPLTLEEWEGASGHGPPEHFVWGSVHLARQFEGTTRRVSTPGGVSAMSPNAPRARLVALSEGVERLGARGARPHLWLSGRQTPVDLLKALYGELPPSAVRSRRAYCYGVDLVSHRPALLPFESVVTGLPGAFYPRALRREPFYTGTACHDTLAQAILHGTLELLKRDAFMVAWYRGIALPSVTWPRRPDPEVERRASHLRRHGLELELFDLRLDFPLPTFLLRATARRRVGMWPRGGAMLVACGAFFAAGGLADGLRLLTAQHLSIALNPAPLLNPLDSGAVKRMSRLLDYWPLMARYLRPDTADAHAFLGRGTVAFEEIADVSASNTSAQLEVLRGWFAERGMRWLVTRLTDRAAAMAGFEVARVVLPGLLKPALTRSSADLSLPRLLQPWLHATLERPNPHPHPAF